MYSLNKILQPSHFGNAVGSAWCRISYLRTKEFSRYLVVIRELRAKRATFTQNIVPLHFLKNDFSSLKFKTKFIKFIGISCWAGKVPGIQHHSITLKIALNLQNFKNSGVKRKSHGRPWVLITCSKYRYLLSIWTGK